MVPTLVTKAEPLVTCRNGLVTMAQMSNVDRTTIAIRVPKKYEFLIKGFVCWLKQHPNQSVLWTCENAVKFKYEELTIPPADSRHTKAVNERMKDVLYYLEKESALR